MDLLTEDAITAELASVPGWERSGGSIARTVTRAAFRDSLLFVGAVAYLAEAASHHPDVTIAWNKEHLSSRSAQCLRR